MRRREFIAGIGAVGTLRPRTAFAQRSQPIKLIGILQNTAEGDQDKQFLIGAFQNRLQELGWTNGRNIQFEVRWSAGQVERLHAQAKELVGFKPDIIFGESTPVIATLRQASDSVPIVFVNANDPIRFGFVQSLARPGGNVTGFISWDSKMGGKWLEILKELAPGVARIGLIYNPQTYTGQQDESLAAAESSLKVALTRLPFREIGELERGLVDFAREPNGGLLVLPDTNTVLHSEFIVKLAGRHRVPAIYPFRLFIMHGGLAWYGTNLKRQYQQAAEYADRILRGAKPADLPVQAPTQYELVINLKAAKAINLEIPPVLLTRADEVIE